jgi:hypothetical protein
VAAGIVSPLLDATPDGAPLLLAVACASQDSAILLTESRVTIWSPPA